MYISSSRLKNNVQEQISVKSHQKRSLTSAVSRWLANTLLTPKELWHQARPLVEIDGGDLIIDDSLLDKPYSKIIPFVRAQYSGKHHRVVNGIAVITLWTDGERIVPVDYPVYDPPQRWENEE